MLDRVEVDPHQSSTGHPRELVFQHERGHIWNVAPRHYFDVSISPLRAAPIFLPVESDASGKYRRMGERSVMLLPSSPAPSWLTLEIDVPASTGVVEVILDGQALGRVDRPGSALELEHKVRTSLAESHRLEINARGALMLRRISWGQSMRK